MGTKKSAKPSPAEILARYEDNTDTLRAGQALAKEAFRTSTPSFEQSIAMAQVVDGGIDEKAAVPLVQAAIAEAAKFGGLDTEIVMAVFEILDEDEDGPEHLANALKVARELSWRTPEAVLDTYYQIYGSDEDEE